MSYPIISCPFCLSPTLKTMSYDTATGRAQTAPDFSIYKAFPFPSAPLLFSFMSRCLGDMTTLAPSVYHRSWYTHSPRVQSHLPGQKPGGPFLMGLSTSKVVLQLELLEPGMWDPKTAAVMTQKGYTYFHTNHGVSSLLTGNNRVSEVKEAPGAITEPALESAGNVGILGACLSIFQPWQQLPHMHPTVKPMLQTRV